MRSISSQTPVCKVLMITCSKLSKLQDTGVYTTINNTSPDYGDQRQIKQRSSFQEITQIVYVGLKCNKRFIFPFPSMLLRLGQVNSVEICYDFSPSKPILSSNTSLRLTSLFDLFVGNESSLIGHLIYRHLITRHLIYTLQTFNHWAPDLQTFYHLTHDQKDPVSNFIHNIHLMYELQNNTQIFDHFCTDDQKKFLSMDQGGLTSVYKTEIVQNLVHHEPQCLYTYVSAGVL